jgi:hypothetical protein
MHTFCRFVQVLCRYNADFYISMHLAHVSATVVIRKVCTKRILQTGCALIADLCIHYADMTLSYAKYTQW